MDCTAESTIIFISIFHSGVKLLARFMILLYASAATRSLEVRAKTFVSLRFIATSRILASAYSSTHRIKGSLVLVPFTKLAGFSGGQNIQFLSNILEDAFPIADCYFGCRMVLSLLHSSSSKSHCTV